MYGTIVDRAMLHLRSPVSYFAFVDFFDPLRREFIVVVGIEEAIDFLLDVAHLRVAEAAAVRNPLDRCRNILEAAQKFLLCAHLIAIAPAIVIVIKCNATVLADEDRLPLIMESICKC